MQELGTLRFHPPLVKREDGKYEGDILGFVKGLRLSARIIYFLRERLSHTGLEVSWGHIIDETGQTCSPECDVIIHEQGYIRKWNGNEHPIMDFKFVQADSVRAIVSCKSFMRDIDKDYPATLKKYGIENVFLFAECCIKSQSVKLEAAAKSANYLGVWWLYLLDYADSPMFETDTKMHCDFGNAVEAAVK